MNRAARLLRHASAIALSLSLLSAALPAGADEAAAAKAFAAGRARYDAKDPAGALPLFQSAVDETQSPNARLYLARCLRDTGALARAYDEMAVTVRDARALAEKSERYVATRDAAAAELALLEAKVGKVVLNLDSTLAGATVSLDGVALDAGALGKPLTVVPGTLRVTAQPPGGAPVEQTVTVSAGATVPVTLARAPAAAPTPLAPVAPVAPSPAPAPAPPADEGGGFGVMQGVGIGVVALGVGGMVLFTVGTLQADDDFATLEEECGGPCSDPSYADVIDSGKTAETLAGVGLGVGIAGLVGGTAMILFGGSSGSATQAAWEPTPNGLRVRF